VRDVAARGDDDDEQLAAVERDEVEPLEGRQVGGRSNCEADLMRGAGDLVRDVRQHVADRAGAPQPRLDLRRRPGRFAVGEQLVDVNPIALIGRHAAGRSVGLADVSLLLEPGHNVTKRRRRDAKSPVRQPQGRNRLSLVDVGLDDDPENPSIPFRQLRMACHGFLALEPCEC
jgi:hypothetical protein